MELQERADPKAYHNVADAVALVGGLIIGLIIILVFGTLSPAHSQEVAQATPSTATDAATATTAPTAATVPPAAPSPAKSSGLPAGDYAGRWSNVLTGNANNLYLTSVGGGRGTFRVVSNGRVPRGFNQDLPFTVIENGEQIIVRGGPVTLVLTWVDDHLEGGFGPLISAKIEYLKKIR